NLEGAMTKQIDDYVKAGGTLVVNIEAAKKLPPAFLGFTPSTNIIRTEEWAPTGGEMQSATPFNVVEIKPTTAQVLDTAGKDTPLVVRNKVGEGAVITVLVPHGIGIDERAHPVLPYLMNGLTRDLLPVRVELPDGKPLSGEILYQVNRT